MTELLRAARLATMTPGVGILENAAVVVEGDDILAVGPFPGLRREYSGPVRDLGDVLLAPGTFNSHTHLEMSHLHGKTHGGEGFTPWMRSMLAQPLYDLDAARVRSELFSSERRGVAFVADISTRNAADIGTILAGSGLGFVSFNEVIGRAVPANDADLLPRVREVEESGHGVMSVAGHALHSTSGGRLQASKRAAKAAGGLPWSLHLAENVEEEDMLVRGDGAFLELLKSRGVIESYDAPGERPVPLAASLGLLDADTLAVHCVMTTREDAAILARSGATVCLCPRSNAHIGEGVPPVRTLLDAGAPVCLGTDGLCSNADLDPYGEVAWVLEHEPSVSLVDALAMVTVTPARFFGRAVPHAARLGVIAPGRLARFSVAPPAVLDILSQR